MQSIGDGRFLRFLILFRFIVNFNVWVATKLTEKVLRFTTFSAGDCVPVQISKKLPGMIWRVATMEVVKGLLNLCRLILNHVLVEVKAATVLVD